MAGSPREQLAMAVPNRHALQLGQERLREGDGPGLAPGIADAVTVLTPPPKSLSPQRFPPVVTMDKEFMNEICQRGRNSRGGEGSWERNHPGETRTRRKSDKEQKLQDKRLSALERNLKGRFSPAQVNAAGTTLKDHFRLEVVEKTSPASFWAAMTEGASTRIYIPFGDFLHREASPQRRGIRRCLKSTLMASL
jgi:hypothetical protein